MVEVGFYQGRALILTVILEADKAPVFEGDGSWLDLNFAPLSGRLGRPVTLGEDPEEWGRSLAACYPPGGSVEAYVLIDKDNSGPVPTGPLTGSVAPAELVISSRKLAAASASFAEVFISTLIVFLISDLVVFGIIGSVFFSMSGDDISELMGANIPLKILAILIFVAGLALPCWFARDFCRQLHLPIVTSLAIGLVSAVVALNIACYLNRDSLTLVQAASVPGGQSLDYVVFTRPHFGLLGKLIDRLEVASRKDLEQARVDREIERRSLAHDGPIIARWMTSYHRKYGSWHSPKRLARAAQDSRQISFAGRKSGRKTLKSNLKNYITAVDIGPSSWIIDRAGRRKLFIEWEGDYLGGKVISSADGRKAIFKGPKDLAPWSEVVKRLKAVGPDHWLSGSL